MSGYTVTFDDVSAASADLAAVADDLGDELRRLSGRVGAVLDSDWHGSAADAFAADWQVWHSAAVDATAALDTLADALRASGAAYEQTDDDVRAAAS